MTDEEQCACLGIRQAQELAHRSGIEVEFADCIIRILDTAAALGLDVAGAVIVNCLPVRQAVRNTEPDATQTGDDNANHL